MIKAIKDILGFNKYDIYVDGKKSDLLQDLGYFESKSVKYEYLRLYPRAMVEIKQR